MFPKSDFDKSICFVWSMIVFTVVVTFASYPGVVNGEVMSSSNYSLQSDSVNFGGGNSGSSAYTIEDTLGELATGISSSTNYIMSAGYQQMQAVGIAVIPPANVVMSPSIGGVTGGTSNGSTNFTVTTDDPAGYTVNIVASSSPALVSGAYSFADYSPSSSNPDFTFTNAVTNSSFGFSVKGTDIASRFKDNGSSCAIGSSQTVGACWDGLATVPKTIVNRSSANHPNGIVTTLNFRVQSGSAHIQQEGVYTATTTITVLPL